MSYTDVHKENKAMPLPPYRNEITRSSVITGMKDSGNDAAWRRFYNLYGGFLLNVAYRKGIRQADAEEILQNVLLEINKAIENFTYDRAKGSFRAWLTTIMRYRVIDYLRKQERTIHTLPLEASEEVDEGALDALIHEEWLEAVKEEALKRLKEKVSIQHYQIFHAAVIAEWPVEKVTQAYGVSRDVVYQVKHRVGLLFDPVLRGVAAEFDNPC